MITPTEKLTSLAESLNQYMTGKYGAKIGSGFEVIYTSQGIADLGYDFEHPESLAVTFDFMNDSLPESLWTSFDTDIYDVCWGKLKQAIEEVKYFEANDFEGSGGGLYYGSALLKPIE